MLALSLGQGRTLRIAQRMGRTTDVHFNTAGVPVAARINFRDGKSVLHKIRGKRTPAGWRKAATIYEHDPVEFQRKLDMAMRHGVLE